MYEKIERYQVVDVPGVGYEVSGSWQDDVHDLKTTIVFNVLTFTVDDARVEAARIPFEICRQGLKTIDDLKGKRIGPGFSKAVSQRVMGKEGCYHMGELILGSVKAAIQAASRGRAEWMDEDIYASRWVEWIDKYRDMCIYFAQPGVSQEGIQNAIKK